MSSPIRLSDNKLVAKATGGRTPAFFSLRLPAVIDGRTIDELLEYSAQSKSDVRLCLHRSPESLQHDMIIVQRKDSHFPPHRHLEKGETWHVLRGELAVFVFDDAGCITDMRRLSPQGEFLYRVGDAQFHMLVPLSDSVVYHESKPGPFLGTGDSLFAAWAPDAKDHAAMSNYIDGLLTQIAAKHEA